MPVESSAASQVRWTVPRLGLAARLEGARSVARVALPVPAPAPDHWAQAVVAPAHDAGDERHQQCAAERGRVVVPGR